MATTSEAKVCIKLLIDTKAKRVLFAEAGKDFVDFLFNILHLPVGTVVRLLTEQAMVGTVGNLYESIQNMSETYFQTNQTKASVLKPKAPFSATQVPLLSLEGGTSSAKRYYTCPSNPSTSNDNNCFRGTYQYHEYVADNAGAICPTCKKSLSREMQFVAAANEVGAVGERGFVKDGVTYMVMDDLVVTPMSTISSITMLNKFNVKEVGALEERVVVVGMPENLKLLKATLQSDMVLTSVFLGDTGTKDASSPIPGDHVTVAETEPITGASVSKSNAMFEPSLREAVASYKPKSKGFEERVEEWFNIISSRQDDIIKEYNRIRRRVDYCATKSGRHYGRPYVSEGEEENPSYVPDEEQEKDEDESDWNRAKISWTSERSQDFVDPAELERVSTSTTIMLTTK